MSDVIKELNKPIYLRVEDNTRFTEEENLVLESIIRFMKKIDPNLKGFEIDKIHEDGCKIYVGLLDFPMFLGYEFKKGIICYHISGGDVMNLVDINKEEEAIKQITEYINKWKND